MARPRARRWPPKRRTGASDELTTLAGDASDPRREQRLVFGEVAETYDRARPGYPPRLVEDVLSIASLGPDDRVLEVGCGTGKASVLFASRGLEMLCLEPSEPMASVARRSCARFPRVSIETSSFEAWPVETGTFGLLISAQAWHWVDPDVRLAKAHQSLAPGGVLALFWHTVEWRDEELRTTIDDLYERVAPDLIATRPGYPGTRSEPIFGAQELADSPLFRSVTTREYPWSRRYPTNAYLELLTTQSGHRMLPPDVLARLGDGLTQIIDQAGGELRVDYVTRLFLAPRAGSSPATEAGSRTGRR